MAEDGALLMGSPDLGHEVMLDGEALITVQPGQKYAATCQLPGFITCLRCGAVVDEQLAGVHDQAHT